MAIDISVYQPDIYTVPISSAALSTILAGHNDIAITGQIVVSDSVELVINNPSLNVVGNGSIHLSEGAIGRNISYYYPVIDDTGGGGTIPEVGSSVRFSATVMWDGVDFAGRWISCPIYGDNSRITNCRLPMNLMSNGCSGLLLENLKGTPFSNSRLGDTHDFIQIRGEMDNSVIRANTIPEMLVSIDGSYNVIEDNETDRGMSSNGFWNSRHGIMRGNIVRRNKLMNTTTNGVIVYDSDMLNDGGGIALRQITAFNASTGKVTSGQYHSYGANPQVNGLLAVICSGAAIGKYFLTSKIGSDVYLVQITDNFDGIAPGDIMNFQHGFIENEIYENEWTFDQDTSHWTWDQTTGICLWTCCVGNEVHHNIGDKSYDYSYIQDYGEEGDPNVRAGINARNNWHDNNLGNWRGGTIGASDMKALGWTPPYSSRLRFADNNLHMQVGNVPWTLNGLTELVLPLGNLVDALEVEWRDIVPPDTVYADAFPPEYVGTQSTVTFSSLNVQSSSELSVESGIAIASVPGVTVAAGVAITAETGTTTASGGAVVQSTGTQLFTEAGITGASAPGTAAATGIAITAETGTTTASAPGTAAATGIAITAETGTTTASGGAVLAAMSVEINMEVGRATAPAPPVIAGRYLRGPDGTTYLLRDAQGKTYTLAA